MGINISKITLLRDRAHSHNICDSIIVLVITVKLLLCLIQILNFRIDLYVLAKTQYFQGWVLSMVSDIHWGSWKVSPVDKGGLPYFIISSSVLQSVFHLVLFRSIFFTQGTTLTTGWAQYWEKVSLLKNVSPCHLLACLKLLKMPRNVKSPQYNYCPLNFMNYYVSSASQGHGKRRSKGNFQHFFFCYLHVAI